MLIALICNQNRNVEAVNKILWSVARPLHQVLEMIILIQVILVEVVQVVDKHLVKLVWLRKTTITFRYYCLKMNNQLNYL